MKKETLVFILGFILMVVPSFGIPDDVKRLMISGCGLFLLLLGYLLLRDKFRASEHLGNGERGTDVFVETTESLFKDK